MGPWPGDVDRFGPGQAAVGALAGANIKKAVMELGGADPFIVPGRRRPGRLLAAETARMRVCGQACIAAKRFIVARPLYAAFGRRLTDMLAAHQPGDPRAIRPPPWGRWPGSICWRIWTGRCANPWPPGRGSLLAAIACPGRDFSTPRLFWPMCGRGMPAFDEELFGPVAALTEAADAEDALALANASPCGLGGSIWTADAAKGLALARRLEAGMVTVNAVPARISGCPLAASKRSGYGRELARHGLLEFANIKTIVVEES